MRIALMSFAGARAIWEMKSDNIIVWWRDGLRESVDFLCSMPTRALLPRADGSAEPLQWSLDITLSAAQSQQAAQHSVPALSVCLWSRDVCEPPNASSTSLAGGFAAGGFAAGDFAPGGFAPGTSAHGEGRSQAPPWALCAEAACVTVHADNSEQLVGFDFTVKGAPSVQTIGVLS